MDNAYIAFSVFCYFLAFLCGLLGLLLLLWGVAQARNPQGAFAFGKVRRTQQLHEWIPALRWDAPLAQVGIFNQVVSLQGWVVAGAGIGWIVLALLAALIGTLILFLPIGNLTLTPQNAPLIFLLPVVGQLAITCMVVPFVVGAAIGFRAGVSVARRKRPVAPRAIWPTRRARDYNASWIDWSFVGLAGAVAAGGIGLALYAASLPPTPELEATPGWEYGVLVALSLTPLLMGPGLYWLTSWVVVSAPPGIVSSYAGIASDAEDYARARALAFTTPLTWRAFGMALVALGFGFVLFPLDIALGSLSLIASVFVCLLGFALIMIGSFAQLARGRLGGRRVGWPGSPRPIAAQATQ